MANFLFALIQTCFYIHSDSFVFVFIYCFCNFFMASAMNWSLTFSQPFPAAPVACPSLLKPSVATPPLLHSLILIFVSVIMTFDVSLFDVFMFIHVLSFEFYAFMEDEFERAAPRRTSTASGCCCCIGGGSGGGGTSGGVGGAYGKCKLFENVFIISVLTAVVTNCCARESEWILNDS